MKIYHLTTFGDAERGTSMYKVFLNTLVATSWNAFAGDIVVKSRDAIKLHQEKYNVNSVILLLITSWIAIRLFSFNKILLFIKKLPFDAFYPLQVVLQNNRFLLC